MPRTHKTKNAIPNQRDTRHETGLAAPGKRISKKSSNGQLNGQPNGKLVSSVPPPALPTTGLNQGLRFPRPFDSALDPTSVPVARDHVASSSGEGTPRDRTASEASVELVGVDMVDNTNETPSAMGSCPEAADPATTRRTSLSQAGGPMSTIATILYYYPLHDAISILILLLSLPPTLVLVIQTLFASLTFVPPTAGISLSTLPNVKEMFNASNLGYPALATILIVDCIFWGVWITLWPSLQNVFLDFSHAVIAVSLSGAAASSGGPTYSIATTVLTVCMVHVLRHKAIHLTALDYLRSVLHKADIGIQLDIPSVANSFLPPPAFDRGWTFRVIRTILGLHIVSQGVTTCIRRSLVKANERDQSVPTISTNDFEATGYSEVSTRTSVNAADATQQPQTVPSGDGRSPGPPPLQRDGKPRESSNKKKKKQANQVRSQQPLWAAIASTKVTFVKEMEQRDAADDAREAARMDTNTKPTPTTPMVTTTVDRIWITEVRDTEVYFSVELAGNNPLVTPPNDAGDVVVGVDTSKPFFIRINGAAWSSTHIMSSATGNESDGHPRYDGEIFGLAPRSTFLCEVIATHSRAVLCSVRIITEAAPSAEQVLSTPVQPRDLHSRPSSPNTTLRKSIESATMKLNDARNKARKTKRDQKTAQTNLRNEISKLRKNLFETGEDEKIRQKMTQMSASKATAEDVVAQYKLALQSLDDVPEHETVEIKAKRSAWEMASEAKRAAEDNLTNVKSKGERELSSLRTETEAIKTKRERMASRHAQRVQEHGKLFSKQQADVSARQTRETQRAHTVEQRSQEEWQYRTQIAAMEHEISGVEYKSQEAFQQLASLQRWNTVPHSFPGYSSPPTPEGMVSGPIGALNPQPNGFPAHPPQPFQSPFHSAQPSTSNSNGPRVRSSSMFSQYSGFTDNGEEEQEQEPSYAFPAAEALPQYSWPMQPSASVGAPVFVDDRKESEGSGGSLTNGSTESNSPRPDAKPFVPAMAKVGTIGPPSKSRDKVPLQASPGAARNGR
ncbi:hypothetical protein LTR62_001276 [Meristemomyces frigidus]|uniref:Ubiquitination network signaling protein n=1 Tax=Meristemomyces frigidus TaxID=1508187 RepID=A0AAN7YBP6_9PEZI|nr:hypothetical protein LTR62_001276 [Meristemomyces frigidus]